MTSKWLSYSSIAIFCCLFVTIGLMQLFYQTVNQLYHPISVRNNINTTTSTPTSKLLITSPPTVYPTNTAHRLYILSYANINGIDDVTLNNYCNCIRINSQMNISINYIGGNSQKYLKGNFDKLVDINEYLKYFNQINNFTLFESKNHIIILFVDAFDVFFQRNSTFIIRKFLELNKLHKNNVIFQAEKNCWPPKKFYCDKYPKQPTNTDGRYLNSGGYIGYLYDLILVFDQFAATYRQFGGFRGSQRKFQSDQGIIQYHFVENLSNIILDYNSTIWQSMWSMQGKMLLTDKGWKNPNLTHYPPILHFNGERAHDLQTMRKYSNGISNTLVKQTNGKINGSLIIELTENKKLRTLTYSQLCSKFDYML